VIGQPARQRMSLLARVDRIVSTVLAIAFLITGFQTGYRLTHGARQVVRVIDHSPGTEQLPAGSVPMETAVAVSEPLPMWRGTDRVNILVMGIDQRPGSALPGRADVIMIASVDPVEREVALLSIARDLWVEIPGHGENRINSAYFYGEFEGTEEAGPGLMKRTIEHNFGVAIDYYGTLDFECFEEIVDILGGITVDVPEAISDDRYPDDSYGYMRIYIPAGSQHMNGETALQYVRARHETSDFSRMRRQQQVILAMREKALRLDIIFSLPELLPAFRDAFSTDLPGQDLLALANLATRIELEDIQLRVIDESMTIPYIAADGAQVLLPRLERIRGMTSNLLEDSPVITESWDPELAEARILVRADASRPGLAIEIADYLRRRGYTAGAESDGLQIESEGTFIASRREMADTAALISALLRVGPEFVILDHNLKEGSDIVVTLGRSFVMPE
jgi:LCP family protein required for cell wall assembly